MPIEAATNEDAKIYFEDIEVDSQFVSPWVTVPRDEVIDFARRWDPYPHHLDEEVAKASLFKGIAACAPHIFAISARLSHDLPGPLALIAGLGGDGLALLAPVRADSRVRLIRRFTAKRLSKSRPGAGIVTIEDTLYSPEEEALFRTSGSMLVACRDASA